MGGLIVEGELIIYLSFPEKRRGLIEDLRYYLGAKIWNSLPLSVSSSTTFSSLYVCDFLSRTFEIADCSLLYSSAINSSDINYINQ